MTQKRQLLETLAHRGEVLDYLIKHFKGNNFELAAILEHGFDKTDYDNLQEYLGDEGEQTQSEMDKEAGASLDRQR